MSLTSLPVELQIMIMMKLVEEAVILPVRSSVRSICNLIEAVPNLAPVFLTHFNTMVNAVMEPMLGERGLLFQYMYAIVSARNQAPFNEHELELFLGTHFETAKVHPAPPTPDLQVSLHALRTIAMIIDELTDPFDFGQQVRRVLIGDSERKRSSYIKSRLQENLYHYIKHNTPMRP